jgi:hypothetical protein
LSDENILLEIPRIHSKHQNDHQGCKVTKYPIAQENSETWQTQIALDICHCDTCQHMKPRNITGKTPFCRFRIPRWIGKDLLIDIAGP